MTRTIQCGDFAIGGGLGIAFVGGPCVLEGLDHALRLASAISGIARRVGVPYVFKASFDKANRTSLRSYRGPGLDEGMRMLETVRREVGVPILTDVHEPRQAGVVAEVADILQIPAFLCRQTDLIVASAQTSRIINVKKGQFLSPREMQNVLEKCDHEGNRRVIFTERGTFFGYHDLVVDMRSLVVIHDLGVPVMFDATHAVQQPGAGGDRTTGQRRFIPHLLNAACAVGVDAIFLEVHDEPERAPSDGPNMVPLHLLEAVLLDAKRIDEIAKQRPSGDRLPT